MQTMSFDICGWRVLTFAVKIAILTFAGDVLWHLQLIRFWHLRLTCYDICGIMTFAVDVLWHLRELWHLRLTCYDICGNFDISGRFWHLRALQGLSQQSNNECVRTALCAMAKLGWRQFWHALQKWLLSSHPWPNISDQCTEWKKYEYAIMYWIQLCHIFFQFWEILSQTGASFYATQSSYDTQNLEKINFDMFYQNYCWAVICYPICVNNVSYERGIIVLSFPVISFCDPYFCFSEIWD